MPDFDACYRAIVLETHLDVLTRAYLRARGEIEDDDASAAAPAPFIHDHYRLEHEKLGRDWLGPLARHAVCRHLLGPVEIEGLVSLLATERKRFKGRVSNEDRNHARYAIRFAFQELDALLARIPALAAYGRDDQQEAAWRPLFRHFARELILRTHAAHGPQPGSKPVDWRVVLEQVVERLRSDLDSRTAAVIPVSDLVGPTDDDRPESEVLERLSGTDEAWLPRPQSLGSAYDRHDAEHIRELIAHVSAAAEAVGIPADERRRRETFIHQLRLRFAATAGTHITRGIPALTEPGTDIKGYLLHELAGAGIAERHDVDCGDALSWLRTVPESSFGKAFDERLTRAREAAASVMRAFWDRPIGMHLDHLLEAKRELLQLRDTRSRVGALLSSWPHWNEPRDEIVRQLTDDSFATELGACIAHDRGRILQALGIDPRAQRLDYARLRAALGARSDDLALWEAIEQLDEAYLAVALLVRMQRNAPKRVFKYFTTICRNAENKGKDAETAMPLDEWMATTARLFADLERRSLLERGFEDLDRWIADCRGRETMPERGCLVPYFSLWNRMLAGARPTSRAVPYLEKVIPVLSQWFRPDRAPADC